MNRGGAHKNDVFVGNIAFGTTEEELRRIFSEVGRVKGVRIAKDQETGKSRGYCFVEFEDSATALSAIRNLNDREVNGRPLRVNFSNNSTLLEYAQSVGADTSQMTAQPARAERTAQAVVDGMSKRELWDVVKDAKDLAESDRGRLRSLLEENPALVDGLVHAMLLVGMIKEGPTTTPAATQSPPPPNNSHYPPPPNGFPAQPLPPPEVVNEALSLTPQMLAQLPPERRAKIEMLREQVARGGGGGMGGAQPLPPQGGYVMGQGGPPPQGGYPMMPPRPRGGGVNGLL